MICARFSVVCTNELKMFCTKRCCRSLWEGFNVHEGNYKCVLLWPLKDYQSNISLMYNVHPSTDDVKISHLKNHSHAHTTRVINTPITKKKLIVSSLVYAFCSSDKRIFFYFYSDKRQINWVTSAPPHISRKSVGTEIAKINITIGISL